MKDTLELSIVTVRWEDIKSAYNAGVIHNQLSSNGDYYMIRKVAISEEDFIAIQEYETSLSKSL